MKKTDPKSGWLPTTKAEPDQHQIIESNYETDNNTGKKEEPAILPIELADSLNFDSLDLLLENALYLGNLNTKEEEEEDEEDTDRKPIWFTDYDPNKGLLCSIRITVKGRIKLKRAALRLLGNPKYLIFSSYEEDETEKSGLISLRAAKKERTITSKSKKAQNILTGMAGRT